MNSAVLLCAGSGKRSGADINKVRVKVLNKELYKYSLDKFISLSFDEIIVVVSKEDYIYFEEEIGSYESVKIILGGATRAESVKNALKVVSTDCVFIHDAARPLTSLDDLKSLINSSSTHSCGALCSPVRDTIRNNKSFEVVDRSNLVSMSTPQYFKRELFDTILNNTCDITDELCLFKDYDMGLIYETSPNLKYTYKEDLSIIEALLSKDVIRIGHSLDYHPFSKEGSLALGGINIPGYNKLLAHSDGDVVIHAVCESILGALNLGDLGTLFPDNDDTFLNMDSKIFLTIVSDKMKDLGYKILNIDVMVYLIEPKLKDYRKKMEYCIKDITSADSVCIKAATLNKRGLISLKEGIGAEAVCLIKKEN